MNAVKLEIGWKEDQRAVVSLSKARSLGRPAGTIDVSLFNRSIVPAAKSRCPECHSIVYSRRNPLCGVCGEPLPQAVLFTPEEAERVKRLLDSERERHKKWMNRRPDLTAF